MSGSTDSWLVTEPYLSLNGKLLEAPYHEVKQNKLRFVDIKKRKLYVIDLTEGPDSLKTVDFDIPVGVTFDIEGVDNQNKILIGGKTGIALLDRQSGKYEYIKRFFDWDESERTTKDDRLRSNDGNVDSNGRLWIGIMNDFHVGPPHAEGHLLSIGSDLSVINHRSGLTIPNSINWNEADDTLYLVHSSEHLVYAYDYNSFTGEIANPREFWNVGTREEPDGAAYDVEGNRWQAIFGGGRVVKISPEGKILGQVSLPTRNVSCCAFAGTTLWITTAEENDPEANPQSAKYGGALYKVDVGVEGVPKNKFKLDDVVKKSLGL